jgi:hypothetical protein
MYDPGLHLYLDFSPSTVSVRNHKSSLVLLPFGFHQQHMGGRNSIHIILHALFAQLHFQIGTGIATGGNHWYQMPWTCC